MILWVFVCSSLPTLSNNKYIPRLQGTHYINACHWFLLRFWCLSVFEVYAWYYSTVFLLFLSVYVSSFFSSQINHAHLHRQNRDRMYCVCLHKCGWLREKQVCICKSMIGGILGLSASHARYYGRTAVASEWIRTPNTSSHMRCIPRHVSLEWPDHRPCRLSNMHQTQTHIICCCKMVGFTMAIEGGRGTGRIPESPKESEIATSCESPLLVSAKHTRKVQRGKWIAE